MVSVSVPVEPQALGRLAVGELERDDAHGDQVRAMDALVALRDHRAHAEQRRALGRPVAELPEPYSLPAITTSGTPSRR